MYLNHCADPFCPHEARVVEIERELAHLKENHSLANEFAKSGTLKHFALRLGYMPHDEREAEIILTDVIKEGEEAIAKLERLK